ncbi:MAG TPA: VanZ family protein [Pyrinomonadaceae bacterium]|nr:VanZ family protein [Pyrinomonadaceae bacterium]
MESEKAMTGQGGRVWSRLWRYGPLLLWLGFIFYASTGEFSADNTSRIFRPILLWLFPDISEEKMALAHFLVRKAAHFTEYAIMAFLAARAFSTSSWERLRRGWFFAALALIVLYALTDEYHQSFVPSRTPSIYDSLIDISGGLTMLSLYAFWRWRKSKKMKSAGPDVAAK